MENDLSRFGLIGQSPAMTRLGEWVSQAAPHWDTVLITGERGTGKELLARVIHYLGPTRGAEPVVVDCAALHPATLESALFGHERGAFTGAAHRRTGYFELAHESSLFLDEISALPLEAQGRLLRFLEQRTLTRVGSTRPIQVRTRIIAATNRDLHEEARGGRFLPDLVDRLRVLEARIPPLRERGDDIWLLTAYFMGKEPASLFTPGAMEFLRSYPFPGNVRELRNLCRRIAIFHPSGRMEKDQLHQCLDIHEYSIMDCRPPAATPVQRGITAKPG
ncbi:MAG TPA: sigma 54-interacting transcriptional regulator [bacterium]|nr:sigma 54-interacting transcriptional regulator [bacterium]HOL96221.1 sigma 54-interacting transcriptional regulator [bacterium]HPP02950.1 sigma 54-interacting transcriptional regulator [bacterium]HXK92589.1 sigma 54-interacting transcriptional regulator [bacterium]